MRSVAAERESCGAPLTLSAMVSSRMAPCRAPGPAGHYIRTLSSSPTAAILAQTPAGLSVWFACALSPVLPLVLAIDLVCLRLTHVSGVPVCHRHLCRHCGGGHCLMFGSAALQRAAPFLCARKVECAGVRAVTQSVPCTGMMHTLVFLLIPILFLRFKLESSGERHPVS